MTTDPSGGSAAAAAAAASSAAASAGADNDDVSTDTSMVVTFFPLILFVCILLFINLPTVIYKAKLWYNASLYLLICNDKKWKKPADPEPIINATDDSKVQRKTIFFVRHGESTWNDTFNKGHHRSALQFGIGFLPFLIYSLSYEYYLLLTGKMDSWFIDSPISKLGISQIDELATFLEKSKTAPNKGGNEEKYLAILRGEPTAPKSKIVSSSLRRAVATIGIAFRDRLKKGAAAVASSNNKDKAKSNNAEKVTVLPSLQEISRNPDTLSITPAESTITASWVEQGAAASSDNGTPFQFIYDNCFDMSYHKGNKPFDTNGYKRMLEFCHTVFNTETASSSKDKVLRPTIDEDYIIVGGHSIWFRSFFKTFLPYNSNHVSKTRKIVNGGIVAFELVKAETKDNGGVQYMVDPKTIQVIYGGF